MPTSPRPAPVSGGVCALHPPHRRGRPSHTPSSAPPTHPWSPAGPRHLPTACLRRSNPHRRISLRFRPTRFLSTVAAVVSGPHPRAVAPRRHTKNALRLRHFRAASRSGALRFKGRGPSRLARILRSHSAARSVKPTGSPRQVAVVQVRDQSSYRRDRCNPWLRNGAWVGARSSPTGSRLPSSHSRPGPGRRRSR